MVTDPEAWGPPPPRTPRGPLACRLGALRRGRAHRAPHAGRQRGAGHSGRRRPPGPTAARQQPRQQQQHDQAGTAHRGRAAAESRPLGYEPSTLPLRHAVRGHRDGRPRYLYSGHTRRDTSCGGESCHTPRAGPDFFHGTVWVTKNVVITAMLLPFFAGLTLVSWWVSEFQFFVLQVEKLSYKTLYSRAVSFSDLLQQTFHLLDRFFHPLNHFFQMFQSGQLFLRRRRVVGKLCLHSRLSVDLGTRTFSTALSPF